MLIMTMISGSTIRNGSVWINRLPINPKQVTFWLFFVLIYCFSGVLTVATNYSYRMGMISLLALPLVALYGIRLDRISVMYGVLVMVVLASGLYNGSSLSEIIVFLRVAVFSYLTYYVAIRCITQRNIVRIFHFCVAIAVLQLPVIILQWLSYPYLPVGWKRALLEDFGFGTFNYSTDYSMAFFLTLIICFLLFERPRNHFVRRRWFIIGWLTLTVFVANAQFLKLLLITVWVIYFLTHFNVKNILFGTIMLLFVIGLMLFLSQLGILTEPVTTFLVRLQKYTESSGSATYLEGGYDRFGALTYLLIDRPSILGDGPSRYYDVFAQTRRRGNTGHFFTFVSEIGLLGWLTSVLIFFLIVFPIKNGRIRISWLQIFMFVGINVLSFTSQAMNDIGVMLSYCIIAQTYLVPRQL
jgi:hypothetical protein